MKVRPSLPSLGRYNDWLTRLLRPFFSRVVMLDAIISDANSLAREFWLKSFKTREGTIRDSVPWKEFAKVL